MYSVVRLRKRRFVVVFGPESDRVAGIRLRQTNMASCVTPVKITV